MTTTLVRKGSLYVSSTARRPRLDLSDGAGERQSRPIGTGPGAYLPWAMLLVSVVLWAVSLPGLRHAPVSQYGLLVAGPVTFPAALVMTLLAFIAAVRLRNERAAVAAIFALVAVQRLTTTLVTEVAPYSWAYKHIGVADQIAASGTLARGVDIYNGWPGLFAGAAAFSEATGVSLLSVAHWITTGVHVAIVVAVLACARAWGLSRMNAIMAAFIVEAVNWVAQDYFAPQAVAFVLMLSFFAVIGHFRHGASVAGISFSLLIFAAIVVTHQLTPFWVLLATGLLVLTRRVRPWWIVVPMAAIAGVWLAANYAVASEFLFLSADPISSAESNISTVGVFGQEVTSKIVRAFTFTFYILTIGAAIVLRRRLTLVLAGCVLAFSPALILVGQSYGGEAIFRVFLYSMLGCSLLLAPTLTNLVQAGWSKLLVAAFTLTWFMVASAQGYYGAWSANLMTASQVRLADAVLDTVAFPSFVTVAAPVWPERVNGRYAEFARFARDYDSPMIYSANLVGSNFDTPASYKKFMALVAGRGAGTQYLIISDQMRIYNWYFGTLPPKALDNLEARMRKDPRWRVVRDRDGVVIFRSQKPPARGSAGSPARKIRTS